MFDPTESFKNILKNTESTLKTHFPLEVDNKVFELNNLSLDKLDYSLDDEYDAKYKDKTLATNIYADMTIKDKRTGKIIDEKKQYPLLKLPLYTDRGTFIVKGNEYSVGLQNRVRPGVYTVKKTSGEISADINAAKGLSKQVHVTLDPETSKFKIGMETSRKSLYPVLNAIGVKDSELAEWWGNDVLEANRNVSEKDHYNSIMDTAERLTGKRPKDIADATKALKAKFAEIELDEDINEKTIGVRAKNVTPDVFRGTTQKVLRIYQGKDKPIDRDSIFFKDYLWVDDFVPEKINLHLRQQKRKMIQKLKKAETVEQVMTGQTLSVPIERFFVNSGLSEISDQYNPLDMINSQTKVTPIGEGGITNMQQVSDPMRGLNPSQAGFVDLIQTPESEKIGINLHLATGVKKKGRRIAREFVDAKTGKTVELTNDQMYGKTIAFAGSNFENGKFKSKEARAIQDGEIKLVPTKEIDYVIPTPQSALSPAMNMVPFMNNNSGVRMFMAGRHMGQAISIVKNEAPLIQSGIKDKSFEGVVGSKLTSSPVDGEVVDVTKRSIVIRDKDGKVHTKPLYVNFPLNNNHVLTTRALHVKPGDKVTAGQTLYDTNFTKDGTLALGTNMRVGYIADGGYNFEDGITISTAAAEKMMSEHMYANKFKPDETTHMGKQKFFAQFPNKVNKDQMEKLDEKGVVRPGTILYPNDPMILAVKQVSDDPRAKIGKKIFKPWRDMSVYWDKQTPGEVVDVIASKDGNHKIMVKTFEPAQVADKISGRFGNKGVITRILPSERMPRDANGEPLEVLLNPLGIPSRVNPGQMLETALAKVAKKTGKPITIESFRGENIDVNKEVQKQLKAAGFNEDGTEEIFDADGKPLGRVLTGYQYMLKLAKQAKTGYSARAAGPGFSYDANKSPAGGGTSGAKAVDILSMYALLSHGATANMREMATDKGSQNDEFWRAVKSGQPLPAPQPTFAYKKFIDSLKAAGVNVERRGSHLQLMPMTDDLVIQSSSGEVRVPKFVDSKDLKPKSGGLMDQKIFGGLQGQKWGHISLAEPVVNPMLRNGLRAVTDMTDEQIDKIIEEKGTKDIAATLKGLDLADMEYQTRKELEATKSPQIESNLNRKLRYIKALKEVQVKPEKAYLMSKLAVLPPNLRPIIPQEDGSLSTNSINWLYRDVMLVNDGLREINKIPYIPDSLKGKVRKALNNGVAAVAGVGDPIGNYTPAQGEIKGVVDVIKGHQAKEGFFQHEVLRRRQDVSGRGVITPDPELGVDEVGIPADMAWTMYKPFLEGRLRKMGYPHHAILDMIDNRDPRALSALEKEMDYRPIMLNRPPSLHKFSFLGFNPRITPGKTIKIPSLVVKGFNADFDGDALIVHTPVRDEAVAEVKNKMMASGNLFNPRDGSPIVVPAKESYVGLYRASQTKEGMDKIKSIVPKQYHEQLQPGMNGKAIENLLARIGKDEPGSYKDVVFKLKRLGDATAFSSGFTVSLKDLDLNDPVIEKIKKDAWNNFVKIKNDPKAVNELLAQYDGQVAQQMAKHKDNRFVEMVLSGGGGKPSQIKQLLATPLQYTDDQKNPIPIPVLSNFGRGMGINDFFTSLFSSRRGMVEKKMETSDPGAFAKQLLINTARMTVNEEELPDDEGEMFEINDKHAYNRVVAQDVKDAKGNVVVKKGDIYNGTVGSRLEKAGIKQVPIHTVLSSTATEGISPLSYGVLSDGSMLKRGINVGTLAGQAIAEPLQQGAMNAFHTAGVMGTKDLRGFDKVKKVLEAPDPKDDPIRASVAKTKGVIESVKVNPAGGYNIMVNGIKHFVKPGLKLNVKEGDTVEPGQVMSEGYIHPKDIVEVTQDMEGGRQFMLKQLMSALDDMGVRTDRRNVEVIVKSIANSYKVQDPGASGFEKGDVVNYDEVKKYNNQKPWELETDDDEIEGKALAVPVGRYPSGTVITPEIAKELKKLDIDKVLVKNQPILGSPVIYGMKGLPKVANDWLVQLAQGNIEQQLQLRVPAGDKANIHGTHPIPGYTLGTEFGKGTGGQY